MNSGRKCASAPARPARDVRGHDQHDVLEVDRAALAVGQAPVVHHLQQDVEDVGVGLLDLVEQHDGVRPAAHRLGQLAALLVADVAGRRADEPRRRCASPCTPTCRCGSSRPGESNMNSASARASSVLPTPVGPRNRNVPIGRSGSCRPARERRSAFATASTASSWPIDALVQALLHVHELLDLALQQPRDGDAGPLADDLGDVLGVDLSLRNCGCAVLRAAGRPRPPRAALQLAGSRRSAAPPRAAGRPRARRARPPRAPAPAARARTVTALDRVLLALPLRLHPVGALLQVGDLALDRLAPRDARPRRSPSPAPAARSRSCMMRRSISSISVGMRVDLDAQPRGRLVDQVDRLVGQEAVGDVAVRQRRGGDDRRVLDVDAVVDLVALLQPAQDRDRVLDRRLADDAPAGSAAPAPRPSRCACGTRRASSRRRRAARRARASA